MTTLFFKKQSILKHIPLFLATLCTMSCSLLPLQTRIPGRLALLAISGKQIVNRATKEPVKLRGIALTSGVWYWNPDDSSSWQLPNLAYMQNETDFKNIKRWGASVVTLYMNWYWFTDNNSPGWAWMDTTLAWAQRQHLYVVPSMVVYPTGGLRGGAAFWSSTHAQDSLVAFWNRFTLRYKGIPEIAGFDITNEPQGAELPTIRTYQIRLIDAIQRRDRNRLIFVEPEWGNAKALLPITRKGIVYNVHQYEPYAYTSQGWPWMWGGGVPVGQDYPGNFIDSMHQSATPVETPIAAGTNDWIQVCTQTATVPAGTPFVFPKFYSNSDPAATIWIDDLEFKIDHAGNCGSWEMAPNGSFEDKNEFSPDPALWLQYHAGNGSISRVFDEHHAGQWSLRIKGGNGWCESTTWQTGSLATLGGLAVQPGDRITFRFWVKTLSAAPSKNAFQMQWINTTTEYWDSTRVHQSFSDLVGTFSSIHNVPMFVGELTPSLVGPRPGILNYLDDALDWLNRENIGWAYYDYRDTYTSNRKYMGIYNGPAGTSTSGCTEDTEILNVVTAHF